MGSIGESSSNVTYRIGVDVGGTNTDAVLISLSPIELVASYKAPTTEDITSGITQALAAVLSMSNVPLSAISCVIIGTTHFVNAVVQRSSSLAQVGVVRLCGGSKDGFGLGMPPFVDYPDDLRELIHGRTFFCHGGHQITNVEISALDEDELDDVAEQLVEQGIADIAVTGIYSPLNSIHESRTEKILLNKMIEKAQEKGVNLRPRITLSHQISSTGFLARENAAILNAALRPLAEKTIFGFEKAMNDVFGHNPCALYLTQNDGSVLSAAEAIDLPIRTFNSGPTNSIRGGKFLWDVASAKANLDVQAHEDTLVVIDIGGTTSDSGLLLPNGLPQMRSVMSSIGGVRTNFALPAIESVGLGGGSVVNRTNDSVAVGPNSVALDLRKKAKLFGGNILTATDIVAAEQYHALSKTDTMEVLGDPSRLADLSPDTVRQAKQAMRHTLEGLIDRTKVSSGDVDVLIVGGGAILVDTNEPLHGVRTVRRVQGGEVANAVGAAISRACGIVDIVADTSRQSIKQAQAQVCDMAREAAIRNGAQPGSIEIAEVTILPVQYVDAKARIIVRAVGTLDDFVESKLKGPKLGQLTTLEVHRKPHKEPVVRTQSSAPLDLQTYRPRIQNGQWIISLTDLEWISNGCRVLGCGGGGDPYENYLTVRAVIEKAPGSVRVISASSLSKGATVGCTGGLGSPEVSAERMEAKECHKAHAELTQVMNLPPVDAFMALEIGGGNGIVNFEVAAEYGVPCIDGDYMGRAYPTCWQTTLNVYGTSRGESLLPATITSGDGSCMTLTHSRTDKLIDKILRAAAIEMGCRAGYAGPPKSAEVVQEQGVSNTVSLAWRIGRAIALEKNIADKAERILEAVGGSETAKILAEGKIIGVERVLKTGHSYGAIDIDGMLADGTKALITIPFKNENAYVEARVTASGVKYVLASVPDLVAVLDSETGQGLGTPDYKYGLKVTVIAISASPRWTNTERGLELGGPRSMGFDDVQYVPVGRYAMPRSVIEEYA